MHDLLTSPSVDSSAGSPLQVHFAGTYFSLRIGAAVLGIALPVVLWLGGWIGDGEGLRGSMSAYYYSPTMRDTFVGFLIAIGVALFLYRGFSSAEDLALDLAGVLAVGVALLPTTAPGGEGSPRSVLHGLFAVGFFLCIAYVCVFRASDTLSLIRDTAKARRLRATYRVIGGAMILSPLGAVALTWLTENSSLVFFVEAAGVWTFGAYWLVKSHEMRLSDAERLAVEGKLAPTPARQVGGRFIQAAP